MMAWVALGLLTGGSRPQVVLSDSPFKASVRRNGCVNRQSTILDKVRGGGVVCMTSNVYGASIWWIGERSCALPSVYLQGHGFSNDVASFMTRHPARQNFVVPCMQMPYMRSHRQIDGPRLKLFRRRSPTDPA